MTAKIVEFKREDWRDAAKTLRKIADDLDAGVHPECTVGALTGAERRSDGVRAGAQVRRPAMSGRHAPG